MRSLTVSGGRRLSLRGAASAAGFTLLEIIVSLAVVSLVLGVVITRMDTMLEWDMRSASNKLASTIRYLYNKASTEGLYIRLILDMDDNVYWVEATRDPFLISAGEEIGRRRDARDSEAPDEPEEEDGYTLRPRKPVFTQVDSFLLKPTKLPDTVRFREIFVEHNPSGAQGGRQAIHFFPNGYVEYAVINLSDGREETTYSLETNPISGRVNIEPTYRRMEEM